MRTKHLPAVLIALLSSLAVGPAPLIAQTPGSDAAVPFVGFALGVSSMPDAFKGCGLGPRAAAEIWAGLSRGTVALEGRGAVMTSRTPGFCGVVLPEEIRGSGEFVSYVEYPFARSRAHAAGELRLRYAPPAGLPLVVAAGVGRLWPQEIPYLVSSVGLRTGNRVRLALDLDHSWYRVPYDRLITEFEGRSTVSQLVRHQRHDWRGGVGVRLGAEIPLRKRTKR